MDKVQITHYSDILCVWAYVSQVRVDELLDCFPDQVEMHYRYLHVFGDVAGKMERDWSYRGGLEGYAEHVRDVAEQFPHVKIHPDVWTGHTPASSMPAHLVLCAVRLLVKSGHVQQDAHATLAWAIRQAFFRDAADLTQQEILLDMAEEQGVRRALLQELLAGGRAHAALADDLETARQQNLHSSPTLVFNEGRQRLTGNVGYRILEANVRELLERPEGQSSWC